PPTITGVLGGGGRVRRWGQSSEQQDGVVACLVQRAPGLVCDTGTVELTAAPHRKWIGEHREPSSIAMLCVRRFHGRVHGSGSLPSAIPSKSGVERYRSAGSGSIARITEPTRASAATLRAGANVPPDEGPQEIPSLPARALA